MLAHGKIKFCSLERFVIFFPDILDLQFAESMNMKPVGVELVNIEGPLC